MKLDEHLAGDGVAIVGFSGRFPGAADVDELWENLKAAREAVVSLNEEDLKAAGAPAEIIEGQNAVRNVMFLHDAESVDAAFFGYHASQVQRMDPQQRIFLEVVWRALEHAGCNVQRESERIGVFAGTTPLSAERRHDVAALMQEQIDNGLGSVATRTSYKLDLRGPSLAIQTACSTSLVAVHYASQSLLNYDCDVAVVGGASVTGQFGYLYQSEGILSPDGRCRAYDAKANGTAPGCGACAVILKRLEDAVSQGDHIYAVVRGTAVNNDGARKVGYAAPSVEGQIAVIRRALAVAGVGADTIGLVEGHGTGTSLGDAIEIAALEEVFRSQGAGPRSCVLGSIKANIGHLDVAAGIAGLIKATLCLKECTYVPAPNVEVPNELLVTDDMPLYVNKKLKTWEQSGRRRAGVSSFGIGGTNAHVILEEYPLVRDGERPLQPQLIGLSAKTDSALREYAASLLEWFAKNEAARIDDVAFTLQTGRAEFEYRFACVVGTVAELSDELQRLCKAGGGGVAQAPARAQRMRLHFSHCEAFVECAGFLNGEPCASEFLATARAAVGPVERVAAFPTDGELHSPLSASIRKQQALYLCYATALGRMLLAWGVEPRSISGSGVGLLVAAVTLGKASIAEALNRGSGLWGRPEEEFAAELSEWSDLSTGVPLSAERGGPGAGGWSGSIDDLSEGEPNVMVISANTKAMSSGAGSPCCAQIALIGLTRQMLLRTLGEVWVSGGPIVWTHACSGVGSRRIGLPGHPLARQAIPRPRQAADFMVMESDASARRQVENAANESLEKRVANLWREVLNVTDFADDADFLSLGGDSMVAVQLLSRIEGAFSVGIPMELILRSGATVRTISQAVAMEIIRQS